MFILGVMVRMFSFILLAPAVWEALNAEPKKKKRLGSAAGEFTEQLGR